ncbi:unnamed protein product [Rhodiola kirilowii]
MDPIPDIHLPAKRQAEDPIRSDSTPLKKPKSGLKKVAEAVMLLSALAEMRGGRSPTQAELDIMAKARAELVAVCERSLAPKDLVGREPIGALIEDLGLSNKVKEQKTGFRPPKLSISDKLLQTKKKMEEKKEVYVQTTHRLGSMHTSSNKTQSTISGVTTSIGHSHMPGSSASSMYSLTTNDGKPRLSSGVLNHTGTNSSFSVHKAERPHYGGPRPVPAGSSFDHGQMNTSTWSVQPHTLSFSRHGNDHKVSMTSRSEEAASRMAPNATRDQPPRPFGTQIPTHQSLQGTGQGPPIVNNHNEISKIVHKLLQKQFPDRPTWTPPSRDYMNKAVTCQVCQLSVNDVESVLLCDACESAYHFRCLQPSNQKVVPRGEWHCPKCLQLSNGKPLPPKYGRVTRNVTASKVPSKVTGFQTTSDQKANVHKVRMVNPQAGIIGTDASSTRISDRRAPQGNNMLPIVRSTSAKSYSEECFSKNTNQSGAIFGPLAGSVDVNSAQDMKSSSLQGRSTLEAKPNPVVELQDTIDHMPKREQASSGLLTGEHSAKMSETVTNVPDRKSATNDLSDPDPVAKLSDPDPDGNARSQESDNNLPKTESMSRLSDSVANLLDQGLIHDASKVAFAAKLKDVVTETSGHKPDTSELQKLEHAVELSNRDVDIASREPDPNTICNPGSITNLSGLGEDLYDSEPVTNSTLVSVNDPAKALQVTNHNKEPTVSLGSDNASNGMNHATTDPIEEFQMIVGYQDDSQLPDNSINSVQWQGELHKAVDDKQYFLSCCIDGVTYQVHEHALFIFDGKLIPSRLQAMWEDVRSGEKWLLIKHCYFPCDLPEAVVRTSAPQTNEVYESDHESTIMADLIKGPCKVLSPDEFRKDCDKNTQLGFESEAGEGRGPVYVCKYVSCLH